MQGTEEKARHGQFQKLTIVHTPRKGHDRRADSISGNETSCPEAAIRTIARHDHEEHMIRPCAVMNTSSTCACRGDDWRSSGAAQWTRGRFGTI